MSTFAFQPTPAAPGRDAPQAPAPTPGAPGPTNTGTAPAEGPPGGPAGQPGGALNGIMPLLIVVLPILLLLMTMRGQNKRQKQLESSLKVGDHVVTQSGLLGKLVEMTDARVKIEIAPGVSVRMLKTAISGVDGGEQKPAESTKDKPQEKKA